MCAFYDPRVNSRCTEDRAEEVREKERANFCDYLKPKLGAYLARDGSRILAAKTQLEDLFGTPTGKAKACSEPDAAREKLEGLFGSGGDKKD